MVALTLSHLWRHEAPLQLQEFQACTDTAVVVTEREDGSVLYVHSAVRGINARP